MVIKSHKVTYRKIVRISLVIQKTFLEIAPGGGGTPIHYRCGYVPPKGVVILKLLV